MRLCRAGLIKFIRQLFKTVPTVFAVGILAKKLKNFLKNVSDKRKNIVLYSESIGKEEFHGRP